MSNPSSPERAGGGGRVGRPARPDEDVTRTQRLVVGDDSRIREVGGTRDARREARSGPVHERGDTVERPAILGGLFGHLPDVGELDDARGWDRSEGEEESTDQGSHPVAVPLAGFFTGMTYVLLLPVLWFWLSDPSSVADLVSVDLVYFAPAILVPVGLALVPRTRRFGLYMLLGCALTGVVVVGVAALVLTFLIVTGR